MNTWTCTPENHWKSMNNEQEQQNSQIWSHEHPFSAFFRPCTWPKNNFSGDFQWTREFLSSVIWALINLICRVWNFSTFWTFFMKILTNFKVFSQNTNRFVHESVFKYFMNKWTSMNKWTWTMNSTYIRVAKIAEFLPRRGAEFWFSDLTIFEKK